jgi:branched-chain amino acid aminotransferase
VERGGRPPAIHARADARRVTNLMAMSDGNEQVFLNGEFVSRDDARLSAFDAGVQHGVGLFETMRAVRTDDGVQVHRLTAHLDRLDTSARELSLTESLHVDALGEAIERTVERSGLERARVRLTITGGDLNLLRQARGGEGAKRNFDPTILIDAQPATAYPAEMYERGVMVTIADTRSNPLEPMSGHKTLNYWWRLRELQKAAAKGGAEALVFQVSNHAGGGCVSNLLLVKDGVVRTPICRGEEAKSDAQGIAIPSPLLPGIVREAVLEKAKVQGLRIEKRMLSIDDVLGADELLLTNSSWGVLPVVRVEGSVIGDGKPGPIGRALLEALASEPGMTGLV